MKIFLKKNWFIQVVVTITRDACLLCFWKFMTFIVDLFIERFKTVENDFSLVWLKNIFAIFLLITVTIFIIADLIEIILDVTQRIKRKLFYTR